MRGCESRWARGIMVYEGPKLLINTQVFRNNYALVALVAVD
jgi:hypothetical protein